MFPVDCRHLSGWTLKTTLFVLNAAKIPVNCRPFSAQTMITPLRFSWTPLQFLVNASYNAFFLSYTRILPLFSQLHPPFSLNPPFFEVNMDNTSFYHLKAEMLLFFPVKHWCSSGQMLLVFQTYTFKNVFFLVRGQNCTCFSKQRPFFRLRLAISWLYLTTVRLKGLYVSGQHSEHRYILSVTQ